MPSISQGDKVTILGDLPDLPCNSRVLVIANETHPSVPPGYLLVLDDDNKAHLTSRFRTEDGGWWVTHDTSLEGPASIPEGLLIPGDVVALKSPLTTLSGRALKQGALAIVVSSGMDATLVTFPRVGRQYVSTDQLALTQTWVEENVSPTRTRWGIIEDGLPV